MTWLDIIWALAFCYVGTVIAWFAVDWRVSLGLRLARALTWLPWAVFAMLAVIVALATEWAADTLETARYARRERRRLRRARRDFWNTPREPGAGA